LIGQSTPKAIADYFGGSNFLLNNQGTFRSAATVSVGTFLKPSNLIEYSPQAFKKLSQTLETLVKAEGLENSQANIQNRIHPPTFTE
jgi:histidinol dehydrogenase